MTARHSLTIFRLSDEISDFEAAIRTGALATATIHTPRTDLFDSRLYVQAPEARLPAWLPLLQEGFGEGILMTPGAQNSAVLIIRVRRFRRWRYFAVVFGSGRHILEPSAIQRRYGLKVALNAIYSSDDPDTISARVRSVDAKTVAQNTLRTRRQANRDAAFEIFGLDVQRDLLNGVVGEPVDKVAWGNRISGADAVHLNVPVRFQDLGELCERIWSLGRRTDYRERFNFIDNVKIVDDPGLNASLQEELMGVLRDDTSLMTLAPPELLDWDDIESFRFSIAREVEFPTLEVQDYVDVLSRRGLLEEIDIATLRKHRVTAISSAGREEYSWSAFRCLSGEISLGGQTFILDEGNFYEVAAGYRESLDQYVAAIPECNVTLPDSHETAGSEQSEGDYNELAADASDQHLLLDKATVRVSRRTSPIEICDILTAKSQFIHVKRKLASSSLSHLFAQGYVSADLLLMNPEFRDVAKAAIAKAEENRATDTTDEGFRGRFTNAVRFDPPNPSKTEVVYAIIARWNGRSLAEALPFFSKVNLRRHADDLRRMGYRVTCKRIEIR